MFAAGRLSSAPLTTIAEFEVARFTTAILTGFPELCHFIPRRLVSVLHLALERYKFRLLKSNRATTAGSQKAVLRSA